VNGSKTFITSGCRADYYTVAVRTGDKGFGGVSLLLIERGTPGFTQGPPLKKMGWWASDTAELYFDDCLVPAENLIGPENGGFFCIMTNFQMERLMLCVMANMTSQLAYEEAFRYSTEREAFGRTDRKSTRLNSSHVSISYAVFCLKKKKEQLAVELLID